MITRRDDINKKIELCEKELAIYRKKLETIDKFGEDVYEDGAVLVFSVKFPQNTYNYAAIKAGGRWHVTGSFVEAWNWSELVETLLYKAINGVWHATEFEPHFSE